MCILYKKKILQEFILRFLQIFGQKFRKNFSVKINYLKNQNFLLSTF